MVDAKDADVWGDEPIWLDGKVAGLRLLRRLCASRQESRSPWAFCPSRTIKDGLKVEIEILGERRPAVLVSEALFDPKAERLRG